MTVPRSRVLAMQSPGCIVVTLSRAGRKRNVLLKGGLLLHDPGLEIEFVPFLYAARFVTDTQTYSYTTTHTGCSGALTLSFIFPRSPSACDPPPYLKKDPNEKAFCNVFFFSPQNLAATYFPGQWSTIFSRSLPRHYSPRPLRPNMAAAEVSSGWQRLGLGPLARGLLSK